MAGLAFYTFKAQARVENERDMYCSRGNEAPRLIVNAQPTGIDYPSTSKSLDFIASVVNGELNIASPEGTIITTTDRMGQEGTLVFETGEDVRRSLNFERADAQTVYIQFTDDSFCAVQQNSDTNRWLAPLK